VVAVVGVETGEGLPDGFQRQAAGAHREGSGAREDKNDDDDGQEGKAPSGSSPSGTSPSRCEISPL
jgi:hypothetical protein